MAGLFANVAGAAGMLWFVASGVWPEANICVGVKKDKLAINRTILQSVSGAPPKYGFCSPPPY